MRHCEYEGANFSDNDFELDAAFGLVHKNVIPRHTAAGVVIDASDGNGFDALETPDAATPQE